MKHYIFLTFNIRWVGGGQCYVASKAKYLESEGWTVHVFSPGNPKDNNRCPIDYLNKYLQDSFSELSSPPHILPKLMVDYVLYKLRKRMNVSSKNDEIIIESHNDIMALWGELLAKRVLGRHFFWTANEQYRLPHQYYKEKINLFIFKFERREIFGSCNTVNRLLEGYRTASPGNFEGVMIDEEPVQDIDNPKVNSLLRYDWNIGYIGRSNKPYMSNIINDIGKFCTNHKEKKIQFVLIGDIGTHADELKKIEDNNTNLTVTELGNLHPLPRSLFKKLDVVIAGSGSARCSVYEGTLTILADPETRLSPGLLGYDTINSVYKGEGDNVFTFNEALIRVLDKRLYNNKENRFPPKRGVKECTKQNFSLIDKADKTRVYYDEVEICKGKKNYKIALNLLITEFCNCVGINR